MWWTSRNNSCIHASLKVDTFWLLYASHSICLSKRKQNTPIFIWLKHMESPSLYTHKIPKPVIPSLLLYFSSIQAEISIAFIFHSTLPMDLSEHIFGWKTAIFKKAATAQISNQSYLIRLCKCIYNSYFPPFSFFSFLIVNQVLIWGKVGCHVQLLYISYISAGKKILKCYFGVHLSTC